MRITIDTEDKGNVNIDTQDKRTVNIGTAEAGIDKAGLFENTTDIPVIDAGPAPLQEIERMQKGIAATDVGSISATASSQDREAQLPLNPLRAGAAAAYQNPANLRKKAPDVEGTPAAGFQGTAAAQEPSSAAIDAGPPQIPENKES